MEEAPVDRPELAGRLAARESLGYLSAAQGGLGFALPGATGLRMALPNRPIVAVVGDGSAIYQIQAVWSAAHYNIGVLFVVLSNGGYAVMDVLAETPGGDGTMARLRRGRARRDRSRLRLPGPPDRDVERARRRTRRGGADTRRPHRPLLLDVAIEPTRAFNY